jgi:hypothetical protein
MKKYKISETLNELSTLPKKGEELYKAECINWKGKTTDTKEFYSEVIAGELLKDLHLFQGINTVTRTKKSYLTKSHCKIKIDLCDSNRNEEIFAKRITGLEFEKIGLILDYQIPLKDKQKDKGVGKIDLISYNNETKTLFLIELKYSGNKETLLRAVLEIYTYYKIVDKDKLKSDFMSYPKFAENKVFGNAEENDIVVVPAVLLVPDCNAYKELIDMQNKNRPMLEKLVASLGVNIFTLDFKVNVF